MSGGSYGYLCYQVEDEYVGAMYDPELDEMMKDLSKLLHDLEWWRSADYGEDSYRKTVKEFKAKWFCGDRKERLEKIIHQECDKLRDELLKMV